MVAFKFVMIIIVVLCFLLVMLILSQNPKGGGLSGTFGGGGGSQMFGVQRTNDFLDKATWSLSILIAVLIIFSSVLPPRNKANNFPIENTEPTQTEKAAPAAPSSGGEGNNTAPFPTK